MGRKLSDVGQASPATIWPTLRFLRAAAALVLVLMVARAAASEDQVREAVEGFLSAFELGDVTTMEAAFASNAVSFARSDMANGLDEEIDVSAYRRVRGMPAQMRELISDLKASGREPPYFSIRPQDLEIQMYGDVALVTFHLVSGKNLGRRTLVLALIDDKWKIVHLHASSVLGTP